MKRGFGNTPASICFAAIFGILLSPLASAQVIPGRVALPGESRATANRLAAVAKLVADKQWSEAIDEYMQIQEEFGDDLVPLDNDHSICARGLCQLRLAALPTEALRLYRDRVESQARKWFEQGKAERDPRLLRRLVDEAFASRHTDRALDLLGDLAFERGRFEEAETWWNMLAPSVKPDIKPRPFDLVYPDPQIDLARVRAKQLLARLFAGKREHWPDELSLFRKSHANDKGDLAGQSGKYADILEAFFKRADLSKAVAERNARPRSWPTFAGDASHNFIAPRAPKRLDYESPPWPVHLSGQITPPASRVASAPGVNKLGGIQPRAHPVVTGDWVIVCDVRTVAAYDLITARRAGFFDLQSVKGVKDVADLATERREHTVTVADNRIYAVLGGTGAQSTLVCLDLPPRPDGQLHLRWHRLAGESAGEDKGSTAFWEGAPIAADNQLFIARTRTDKNPSLTFIECHDADTGQPRWKREICFVQDSSGVSSHSHLLTVAGQNLVYNSDAGVIVAIDATSGRRAWACRYPSRGLKTNNGEPSPRGLSPVVYQSGRVLVAPADYEGLLCLDALTGEKIWERDPIEVVHLLGVAKGRLILTTANSHRHAAGIRALDAATGADLRRWIQPEDGTSLLSYGRGFLAGDRVFWPTFNPQTHERVLYVLNQDDGQVAGEPAQFWQVHCGNMALGNGCLAVADQENLHVYVPPARLLEQREDQARNSGSATASYRLAEALADAGQSARALEAFEQAAKITRPKEAWGKMPLLEKIRAEQHQLLLSLAEQASKSHQLDVAKDFLRQAAGIEFDVPDRLRAYHRIVETISSTEPNQALAICKDILQDDALSAGWLIAPDGTRRQARWWVAEQVARLSPKDADRKPPPAKSSFAIRELSNERLGKSEGETDSGRLRPRWQIPLTPSWQITLDREETFLGVTDGADRCLLACRGQDLICREFMNERPRWVQKLALTPTWFSTWGDACLTGSSQEIRMLNLTDGRILWSLSAPPIVPPGDAEERELRQFRLVGSVLIFFQGQLHLFGVDVQTGRVIWEHQAPGAALRLRPPAGRFFPSFYAGEKGILVQTSGSRFWIIDPYTGKLTGDGPTSSSPWPRSPIPLGGDRVAIVADSQSVMLLSLPGGNVVWKKTLGQPSMTAEGPQLVWNGQSLCQIIDGWRLARLDLTNGKEVFEKAISTEPINGDLGAWDTDYFYYVNRGVLQARSLTSARLLWQQPLPRLSVPWRVVDLDKHLLLMPSQPPFTLRWDFFLNPQPMSFPVEMQWDDVTLLLCDKETGKIAQQWAIHGSQSPIRVQVSHHALVVTVGGRLLVCQPSSVR